MKLKKRFILPGIALAAAVAWLIPFLIKALSVGAPKPQDPSLPFPYHAETVNFENLEAGITLAGTLTLPSKDSTFPAVILISGSGPQNRDEELMGHRPFLVLADHLTKNGIAVLRYDDRGFARSTGNFRMSALSDFASDVKSAIAYLRTRKEIDHTAIGLIGHSEGAVVAPMVAATSDDVSFIVMLAGPGIKLSELMPLQYSLIAKTSGATESQVKYIRKMSTEVLEMVLQHDDSEVFTTKFTEYVNTNWDTIKTGPLMPAGITREKFLSGHLKTLTATWYRDLLHYDPAPVLENVKCPVLALNGEKDVQVPPKENLTAITNALTRAGNADFTVKELAGLNHLFQECETGGLHEYAKIQQTFSPVALEEISRWVKRQVGL